MPKLSLVNQQQLVQRVAARLTDHVSARVVALVDERTELKDKITALTEDLKAIDGRLLREADKHDGEIVTDAWSLKAIDGTNRTINKELLVQHGVKPSIIAAATVETQYRYARIFPKTEKKTKGKKR